MDQLLEQIGNLEIEQEKLGTKEFQKAVLEALKELIKEQESLKETLNVFANRNKVENLDELQQLITDESSLEDIESDSEFGNIKFTIHTLFNTVSLM